MLEVGSNLHLFSMSMNINDVYGWTPITSTYEVHKLWGPYVNPFPELGVVGSFNFKTRENITKFNKSLEVRVVKEFIGSYERYQDIEAWLIASLWYNNEPFMVLRNTGRDGDHFPSYFISDKDTYHDALYFLFNLMVPDDDFSNERWLPLSGSLIHQPGVREIVETINDDPVFELSINHSLRYGLYT